MLANGYFAANAFLSLYASYEALKKYNAADTTTWFPATLAWLSIRKSYALLLWLFNQNSKDLVVIQKSMGIEVDDSLLAWYEKVTPMAQVNDRPSAGARATPVLPILYYLSAKPSPRSTMRCPCGTPTLTGTPALRA